MKPQTGIYPCPTSYPSSTSVLPYKAQPQISVCSQLWVCYPKPARVVLVSFLPMLVHKDFPATSMRHRYSTVFPRTVKSIITRTERCSALDWAHLLPHSICFPLPLLLNHALLRELRSSEVLSCFAASFWVEQLMSSLGLHQPLWDIVFPFIQREQLRHFNLCVYLEPEEYSAVLETMCN